ncbi:MAG: hypothetical protein Q8Q90_00765 [bacterium]|nr:hypothetical protein [bacterium]
MIKKLFAKLVNWESVRGQHKPSAEEVFRREQVAESNIAREREEQHRQNKQEEGWEEVKLPDGTERSSK